jgi:hypothetical protein
VHNNKSFKRVVMIIQYLDFQVAVIVGGRNFKNTCRSFGIKRFIEIVLKFIGGTIRFLQFRLIVFIY